MMMSYEPPDGDGTVVDEECVQATTNVARRRLRWRTGGESRKVKSDYVPLETAR
jgi:hypothetical protein